MQQTRTASPRTLVLAALLIVVAVVGAVFFLRGSSPSTPAHAARVASHVRHHASRHAASHARHHASRHVARHAHVRSRHVTRRHTTKHHVAAKRSVRRTVHHATAHTPQHQYAVAILPLLNSSVHVFDQAAHATAGITDYGQLGSLCQRYNLQVQILEQEFNGIPHAVPWYSRVGTMHHRIAGIYHDMQGALQQCDTSVANQDYGTAAVAQEDIVGAAGAMDSTDAGARRLAHQR